MKQKLPLTSLFFITMLLSCTKNSIEKGKLEVEMINQTSHAECLTVSKVESLSKTKIDYAKALLDFKQKHKFRMLNSNKARYDNPSQPTTNNEFEFLFVTGGVVGDPFDYVIAADGNIISASNSVTETEAKDKLSDQINTAKLYLLSNGLDFSDVYSPDDYRYLHAANIYFEIEEAEKLQNSSYAAKQNTLGGCIMQAVGIKAALDAFSKQATKKIIIEAVAKIAKRYLGFIGAAIAVYDFLDCYYGSAD